MRVFVEVANIIQWGLCVKGKGVTTQFAARPQQGADHPEEQIFFV